MKFEKIVKDCMKEEYAKQIVEWNYEGDYADYNLWYNKRRQKR